MSRPLCVVGSLNMDLVVRAPRLPRPGETLLAGSWDTVPGGKGANQAVAMARMGARVVMIGAVGSDPFGVELRAALEGEGVDVSGVRVLEGRASGVALISVQPDGENTILVVPGANLALAPRDIEGAREAIARSALLLLQLECPLETVASAARCAREAGVPVWLNAAPATPEIRSLLTELDTLIVNRGEAALLLGNRPEPGRDASADGLELATALAELGPSRVVVTLGRAGAVALERGRALRRAAFPVPSIDAVGAGDAFTGALAVALNEGAPLARALELACAAGALATISSGAQPSLPRREPVEALLAAAAGAAREEGNPGPS